MSGTGHPDWTEEQARQELVRAASYAADRIDLVQSVGGNVSAKVGPARMLIKASGTTLADNARGRGITPVDRADLLPPDASRLEAWERRLSSGTGNPRPSIEVSLHALLGPVVLHTHAVLLNAFLCAHDGRRALTKLHPIATDAIYLPYAMPGLEIGLLLCRALQDRKEKGEPIPPIVLLENHGLVVQGPSAEDVIETQETLLRALEGNLSVSLRSSTLPRVEVPKLLRGAISQAVPSRAFITALRLARIHPPVPEGTPNVLFPDAAVLGGAETLDLGEIEGNTASRALDRAPRYQERWNQLPRTWRFEDTLLCTGTSQAEADSAAEVAWAQEMILTLASRVGTPRFLPEDRIRQLLRSDAEKYRQDLLTRRGATP